MNKRNKTSQVFMTQSMNFNMTFSKQPSHSYSINIDGAEATLVCYKDRTASFVVENDKLSFAYKGIIDVLNVENEEEIDSLEVGLKLPNNEGYVSIEGIGKMDYVSPKN